MNKKNLDVDVQNNFIFINLPESTDEVFISVVFKYGYYDEDRSSYGLGHLIEHYIVDRLLGSLMTDEVYGSISNVAMRFDIDANKQNVVQCLKTALDVIFAQDYESEALLKKEKERIRIELYEHHNEYYNWLRSEVMQTIIDAPECVKRKRIDQLKNIEKATSEQLLKTHNTLTENPPLIFIGGCDLSSIKKDELVSTARPFISGKQSERKTLSVSFARKKHRLIEHFIVESGYKHFSIIFPSLSLKDSNIEDRLALGFLCEELQNRLQQLMGEIGVYKIDYDYIVGNFFGFVRFFSFVPSNKIDTYKKIIFFELKNVLFDASTEKKLEKFKRERKKQLQKDWQENISRMDWIIDDMIDFNGIIFLPKVEDGLKKVTLERVKKVSRKVFGRMPEEKMYTLTVKSLKKG